MNRYYFQCDISEGLPEITEFGKKFIPRLNSEETPTSAIILVTCTEEEFNTAEAQAGIENKTFIILTKEEARILGNSWNVVKE